jgi:hypothetical protein
VRAAKRARLLSYDCDHNDCPPDFRQFRAELGEFLIEHGLLPVAAERAADRDARAGERRGLPVD